MRSHAHPQHSTGFIGEQIFGSRSGVKLRPLGDTRRNRYSSHCRKKSSIEARQEEQSLLIWSGSLGPTIVFPSTVEHADERCYIGRRSALPIVTQRKPQPRDLTRVGPVRKSFLHTGLSVTVRLRSQECLSATHTLRYIKSRPEGEDKILHRFLACRQVAIGCSARETK
jgi:hypothetical protein